MGDYVITCRGVMGKAITPDPARPVVTGQYLKSYDPEAYDGHGFSEWTANPAEAMRFPDHHAAYRLWQAVPQARPVREDGQPNRPLTVFTIEIGRAVQPAEQETR